MSSPESGVTRRRLLGGAAALGAGALRAIEGFLDKPSRTQPDDVRRRLARMIGRLRVEAPTP